MWVFSGCRRWRQAAAWCLGTVVWLSPGTASAVPSFAEQTGQPCAACHVGAFGPQLTRFGRDFKLNGYTASDGKNHFPPIAASVQASFTHTNSPQAAPPAPNFATNNNFAVDQTSLYYAGKIYGGFGAFIQTTYDGVAKQLHIDNADIRYAHDSELFEQDWIYGFTANNSPTVSDLWNSTPVWGFPGGSPESIWAGLPPNSASSVKSKRLPRPPTSAFAKFRAKSPVARAEVSSEKSPNVPAPHGRHPCDHFLHVSSTYPK